MSIYDTLNEQQKKGVLTTDGPVLVLAGAGSGKTRVLTQRIAYLIEHEGVNPWNILAITFTNKAAKEMRTRVDNIVGYGSESIWVATFHSTCVRILRRHIDRLGYGTNFTIYDTDDQKAVIKDICKRLNIDTALLKERTIMSAISSAKDNLITEKEYEQSSMGDYNGSRISKVYSMYQETLKKNNCLDFDDIIVKTVELFKSCPEVLENYQNRFLYIMVDEYQDTNTAQFELIRLLASKNRNLCVVGDDDQSIYKFRGANIRNILDFEKVYPEAVVIKLEQNYRSTQTILDAANSVIENNKGRKSKSLWTDRGMGNRIHFREFDMAYEESEYITGDIRRKKRELICDYSDCAVLYRTNAQSRLLEESFVALGIPYNVVGGVNFYARKEIKDIISYLKTIDNGNDDLAVKRIINVPKRGIGATSIAKVQNYADINGIRFFDALQQADKIPGFGSSAAVEKLKNFATFIQVFRIKQKSCSLEELITDLLETTEYIKKLEDSDDEAVNDRIQNIDELISKIVAFELEKDKLGEEATLSSFLEEVALVSDIDRTDSNSNRVLLMTVHSAKGLEFSQVYLAGMEDGVFPGYMTTVSYDESEMEEERRLAYVAITRAKDDLTISCAKQRMVRGKTQYNSVSRFVEEIPEQLLDNIAKKRKSNYIEEGYQTNQYQKNLFKSRPFQAQADAGKADTEPVNKWQLVQSPNSQKLNVNNNRVEAKQYTGLGAASASQPMQTCGKDISKIMTSRPKAVARKKETPAANKPYIASLDGISKGIPQGALTEPDYVVGDRVRHIKYGDGTVTNIVKDTRDYKVTVNFDSSGNKVMYAAFAKLKKLSY